MAEVHAMSTPLCEKSPPLSGTRSGSGPDAAASERKAVSAASAPSASASASTARTSGCRSATASRAQPPCRSHALMAVARLRESAATPRSACQVEIRVRVWDMG